jgi:hypothetical protein
MAKNEPRLKKKGMNLEVLERVRQAGKVGAAITRRARGLRKIRDGSVAGREAPRRPVMEIATHEAV